MSGDEVEGREVLIRHIAAVSPALPRLANKKLMEHMILLLLKSTDQLRALARTHKDHNSQQITSIYPSS